MDSFGLSKGMPNELTFDEFRNMQTREKNRQAQENEQAGDKGKHKGKGKGNAPVGGSSVGKGGAGTAEVSTEEEGAGARQGQESRSGDIGDFLELPQVQSFVVLILVLDTFAAMGVLLLNNHIAFVDNTADTSGGAVLPSQQFSLLFGLLSLQSLSQALATFNRYV